MREMSLGKINQQIEWTRNDEIGMLVTEYNKMVRKLEQSALALAKSEREGAWREMARQVAHEIKNPLTPMKLSIQYLQKAMQEGGANLPALYERMSITLIEQIDQLSKIAGDFSQFANIGNARMERFSIAEVIESLIQLYRANAQINIAFSKESGLDEIKADRVQMNRLFTNLILNAIEAKADPNAMVYIDIQQQVRKDNILITLTDQSGGIPAGMTDQLFTPNFTTKTSGTGLGLAICKGIVEHANGRIWFETTENVGTRFFVELPLA
jgi:nitrogen fixation/metabolism regulation signal transduction histidine kinase